METRMNTGTPARINTGTPARTAAPARKNAAAKAGTGWKVFIMAASLAATVGGWGILAVGQASATAQASAAAQQQTVQQVPAAAQSSQSQAQSTSTRRTLRTVTGQPVQPQVVTRTRSSQ